MGGEKLRVDTSNRYGHLKEPMLIEFEEKLGARLPEDFREYLLKYNGGLPEPNNFNIHNDCSSIHHMFGIHDGPEYTSLKWNVEINTTAIPNLLMPFADDPFGNILCIGVKGDVKGEIFFWDHEVCEDGNWSDIVKISDSFTLFINSLFEYIDPDETVLDEIVRNTNTKKLEELLKSGFSLETVDEFGRTIIENASIAANNELIFYLHSRGAKLRNSLELANQNAEFFDEHKSTAELLEKLYGTKN